MTDTPHPRPLSPHLQIYRPQITSILSILHRITAIILTVGLIPLVWWLSAVAAGPEAFAGATDILGSIIGQIMLFGWTLAFWYKTLAGIRHLVWDLGYALDLKEIYAGGYLVIGGTLALTILTWILVLAL